LKNPSQKGLVEWLKVKALSSSPSIAKKKKEKSLMERVTLKLVSTGSVLSKSSSSDERDSREREGQGFPLIG
jgi:hypothetical protein